MKQLEFGFEKTLNMPIDKLPRLYRYDPLHLFKRAQYRLLDHELYSGFGDFAQIVAIGKFQGMLKFGKHILIIHKVWQ